ncbi:hypothetical protein BJP41_03235 [Candidatus Williamhamiltonella defendens]|uniref:Uncharacterized protein n=1 Tax=Candidatus Williamhamiltonella defendens TaxID=138072 RepID=A0A2D3T6U1_9ENTR|nr:hypothetical protein [Candidatus Hamiltonella defensa]ATW29523.1 hypothetical protein BJP41_03235 [Candidatus Hamiltonella defensa]ATW31508.1 hypothetical protein BJP42_03320 [Candidatus Hamiltonella defensa]
MLKKVKRINDEVSFQNEYPEFNSNWSENFARKAVVSSLDPVTNLLMKEEEKFFNDNNDQPQRKITEWFYRKNSKGNERLYQKKITLLKENGEIKDSAIFDKNGNKITTFIEPSLNPDKSSAHHLLDNQGVAVSNANANTVIEDLIAPLSLRDKNMTLILFDLLKAFMQHQPDDIKVSFGKYLMKLLEPSSNKAPVVKKEPHQDNAQAASEAEATEETSVKANTEPHQDNAQVEPEAGATEETSVKTNTEPHQDNAQVEPEAGAAEETSVKTNTEPHQDNAQVEPEAEAAEQISAKANTETKHQDNAQVEPEAGAAAEETSTKANTETKESHQESTQAEPEAKADTETSAEANTESKESHQESIQAEPEAGAAEEISAKANTEPHQDNSQAGSEAGAAANVAAKESQVPSSVAESINQQRDHTRPVRSVSGQVIQALQKNLLIQSSPLFQLMTSNIEIMSEIIEPLLNRNSAGANQSLEEAMSSFSGNCSVEAISIPINHTKQIEETNIVKLPAVTATM